MRSWAFIDCSSKKVPDIMQCIENLGITANRVALDQANYHDFSGYEAVVVSGGPRLFTDPATFQTLVEQFTFLDHLTLPVLGICLGHQAIALRNGAEVHRGAERRQYETVELLDKQHPLLAGLESDSCFATDHCEGVTLPEGFQLLGQSSHYDVEIMACPEGRQFGVQFHPEISGTSGLVLFQNFARLVAAYNGGLH